MGKYFRLELLLIVIILGIGAFLRFLFLDTIPPGWHHDEALMGIMAREVFENVQRPIFFQAFLGQEPLYIYISAGLMWLMGGNTDILPVRVASALVGIATIGVTYLMARDMFGRRVGLISAALLATSFLQVMLSREGYRVITQPLMEALTIFFLWRACQRQTAHKQSLWYFIAAGIAFGGTAYTYLGARLFPFVLVLFALWWLVFRGRPAIPVSRRLGLFFVIAAVTLAPLGIYFLVNPGTFSARIDQVSVFQPGVATQPVFQALLENIFKLLSIFTVFGDTLWRWNIPGRPVFVGIVGILLYVGILVALRDTVKQKAAAVMALSWFIVMLAPSFLSVDVGAYTPRSMGLVPMLYVFPAIGLVFIWDWAVDRGPALWKQYGNRVFAIIAVLVVVADGVITYQDYFIKWAPHWGAAFENMDDYASAGRYVAQQGKVGQETLFMSSDIYHHATVAHLASAFGSKAYDNLRWFDGNSAVVFPEKPDQGALYVFPYAAIPKQLDAYLPKSAIVDQETFGPNNPTKLIAYRLSQEQLQGVVNGILNDPSFTKADVIFGGEYQLIGVKADLRAQTGDDLTVTAIWRPLQGPTRTDRVMYAHLLDHQQVMWAATDRVGVPALERQIGDIVVEEYHLKIGTKVPTGRYTIALGAYDRDSLAELKPVTGANGNGTMPTIAVKVVNTFEQINPPAVTVNKKLGDTVSLVGYDMLPKSDQASSASLKLAIQWQASATPKEDYTAFVQLLSQDGKLVAQSDSQPAQGRLPTTSWDPNERIYDVHELKLDPNLPAGQYKIIAGMYLLSTGQRIPAADGGDHLVLTTLSLPR
jgi:4-amino-4-deoxy-L-arabinose transferase-like glycosyltransferase